MGKSLGQSLGVLWAWRNLLLTQLFGDTTSIKLFGNEKLQADQELGNEADKFAMKVVKNNEIVGHLPREYSQTLWYFIARGGKICVEVTGL